MKKTLFLILGIGILATSCAKHTINSLMIDRDADTQEWHIDNRLLAHEIKLLQVKEIKEGDLLYVNVQLENTWRRPITGKIKVEFYDEHGVQMDNPWGWRPITLEAHQKPWFKFMAPKTEDKISKIRIMTRGIGKASM
jgi:uncharacterized protein YcfL